MGFGTSEAVRYLMARGLEGVTTIIAAADTSMTLHSMFEMAERQERAETIANGSSIKVQPVFEMGEPQERAEIAKPVARSRSGPSNTRPKVENPTVSSLFDITPTKKKEKK
jgi:hypothetical protein